MEGTVNEGILLDKGQEKRKTLWYQQMKGICPCTFRGRQIRETLIFSLERIFDKCNFFFIRPLLDNTFAISPVSHSVSRNFLTWLLQD